MPPHISDSVIEPHILAKEPYISAKEPYISAKVSSFACEETSSHHKEVRASYVSAKEHRDIGLF